MRARKEPSAAGLQPLTECIGLDEERERPLAVDLDDRDRLPVARFEVGVAADVDALEVARADLLDDLEGALAEVTAVGDEQPDSRDRGLA